MVSPHLPRSSRVRMFIHDWSKSAIINMVTNIVIGAIVEIWPSIRHCHFVICPCKRFAATKPIVSACVCESRFIGLGFGPLVGATSSHHRCPRTHAPHVFINVYSYIDQVAPPFRLRHECASRNIFPLWRCDCSHATVLFHPPPQMSSGMVWFGRW